jgi:hypothetical protein
VLQHVLSRARAEALPEEDDPGATAVYVQQQAVPFARWADLPSDKGKDASSTANRGDITECEVFGGGDRAVVHLAATGQ